MPDQLLINTVSRTHSRKLIRISLFTTSDTCAERGGAMDTALGALLRIGG